MNNELYCISERRETSGTLIVAAWFLTSLSRASFFSEKLRAFGRHLYYKKKEILRTSGATATKSA
jgi:hypothetical protein